MQLLALIVKFSFMLLGLMLVITFKLLQGNIYRNTFSLKTTDNYNGFIKTLALICFIPEALGLTESKNGRIRSYLLYFNYFHTKVRLVKQENIQADQKCVIQGDVNQYTVFIHYSILSLNIYLKRLKCAPNVLL